MALEILETLRGNRLTEENQSRYYLLISIIYLFFFFCCTGLVLGLVLGRLLLLHLQSGVGDAWGDGSCLIRAKRSKPLQPTVAPLSPRRPPLGIVTYWCPLTPDSRLQTLDSMHSAFRTPNSVAPLLVQFSRHLAQLVNSFTLIRLRKLTPIDFLLGGQAGYQSYPPPFRHAFLPSFFCSSFPSSSACHERFLLKL